MYFKMRQITAICLLVTILLGMVVVCNAHNTTTDNIDMPTSAIQSLDSENSAQACGNCCPCSPVKSKSDNSGKNTCHSFCHAPLAVTPLFFSFVRPFTYLHSAEIILYFPKVYLSLFVPPDSAAI